jgi:thiamine-monophosphate kinase
MSSHKDNGKTYSPKPINLSMKLADLGEREAIRRLTKHIEHSVAVGIGDDCAAIKLGTDFLLITTDIVAEHTHLPPEATGFQIGWFVTAINLSDIAAKGGRPLGLTLSIGVPASEDIAVLEEIGRGANLCATKHDATIVGGDTKEASQMLVSGAAVGLVKKMDFMPRKGSQVDDIVCVTGPLGRAGGALHALKYLNKGKAALIKDLLEPNPRIPEGQAAAATHGITSSMDISDGLASSLYQLKEINNIGFKIYWDKIPQATTAKKFAGGKPEKEKDFVLYSGGDYELLFTVKPKLLERVTKAIQSIGGHLYPIGAVIEDHDIYLMEKKTKIVIENRGYEHFL